MSACDCPTCTSIRYRKLVEKLRPYLTHGGLCMVGTGHRGAPKRSCTCGLADLLTEMESM